MRVNENKRLSSRMELLKREKKVKKYFFILFQKDFKEVT